MKDIQAIITQRAEERLKNDIENYFRQIKSNPIFKEIQGCKVDTLDGSRILNMDDFFYPCRSWAGYDKVFSGLRNEYVEKESKDFMSKVDQIKEDIDSLLNQ
jgi:hypothetical protein